MGLVSEIKSWLARGDVMAWHPFTWAVVAKDLISPDQFIENSRFVFIRSLCKNSHLHSTFERFLHMCSKVEIQCKMLDKNKYDEILLSMK